jgi:hypothetical protein
VEKFTNLNTDFRLQHIHAHHPLYRRSPDYIDRAAEQTFGAIIPEHRWNSGYEANCSNLEGYFILIKLETGPGIK